MKNRKEIESFIMSYIGKISDLKENVETYKNYFSKMSDSDFSDFIKRLESEEEFLTIIAPNFEDGLNIEKNLKIAEELGHDFFEQLWIEDGDKEYSYLTPSKYFVLDSIVRRASQMIQKKMSVPSSNSVIDKKSGQVTGESKGARVSYIELRLCVAMGIDEGMEELVKYRGGDLKGGEYLDNMLVKYGRADLGTLRNYQTSVTSVDTLHTYLTGMMLKNTLKAKK